MHNKGSYPRIDFRAISCLRFSSTHTHLEHSSTGRHMKGSQSRMRRIFLIGFTILASNAVWAGGPWTEKSYKDWDRNDVRKVLFDSPWVSHFVRTRRALEFEVPDQGPSGMELRGYHSKESKEDDAQTTEFYVRWVSSRTLREAWARKLVLQKRVSENEIDKYLPPSSDDPKAFGERTNQVAENPRHLIGCALEAAGDQTLFPPRLPTLRCQNCSCSTLPG